MLWMRRSFLRSFSWNFLSRARAAAGLVAWSVVVASLAVLGDVARPRFAGAEPGTLDPTDAPVFCDGSADLDNDFAVNADQTVYAAM